MNGQTNMYTTKHEVELVFSYIYYLFYSIYMYVVYESIIDVSKSLRIENS